MQSKPIPYEYTCDSCGKEHLTNAEVARVSISAKRPPYSSVYGGNDFLEISYYDLCKDCLMTARVANPASEYENNVRIDYYGKEKVFSRILRWIAGGQPEPLNTFEHDLEPKE